MRATRGNGTDRGHWIGRGHCSPGAEFCGSRQRCWRGVNRHDPSAEGYCDRDRRKSHTTTAKHRKPLLGPEPGLCCDRVEGGGEAAAQNRRRDEIHSVRKPDEIEVCSADCDLLSEGALVAEPWLGLIRADLSLSSPTPIACPTTVHERDGDPIANREC